MTEQFVSARNAYYASLSEEQKKSFDDYSDMLTSRYSADLAGGMTADGTLFYRNPENHKLEPINWNKAE